jgi:F420-dependent oxidoreductase-like protein
MRVGLKVNQHQLDWGTLSDRVSYAEEQGFDGAWLFDHFKATDGDPVGPCMESWTLLSALAATTQCIRLGVMVTGITYRHPSILAAQAVTVDQVSGGRLELALGAAWHEQEHRELGLPFPTTPERMERLEEGVQLIRLLMTEDGARFQGRHYRLDGVTYRPRPVQQPHPPIWVGAGGERVTIPIAARHADVWHCFEDFDVLPRKVRVFEEQAKRAGRDPASIVRATNLSIGERWDDVTARAEALRELGFSYLVVPWPSGGRDRLDGFVQRVMPRLTGRPAS